MRPVGFTRNGGSLGEPGSVAYLFEQKGFIVVGGDEDEIMLAALESGAEDVRAAGDQFEVITAPTDFPAVRDALVAIDVVMETAEVTQLPSTAVAIDEDAARQVLRLVDALEDLDDVQSVFGNFDVSDEVLEAVAG
jgi:transcriptional/translational regulatory protein YebC/TACO1